MFCQKILILRLCNFYILRLFPFLTLPFSLVRLILEYANAIWGPYHITDQKLLERVQWRATKLVPSLKELPYAERLSHLQLPSLCYRRERGDLILVSDIKWFI